MRICKNCKNEIDKKAVVCPACGVKITKPIFKRVWFWALIIIIAIGIGISGGNNVETVTTTDESVVIEYLPYELNNMIDELNANAMAAEHKYQNAYVEFTCKISNFDSDGKYISVEPIVGEYWFDTVMCYIKSSEQLDFLMTKAVGDTITIKGQVSSIGEVLGYSINIDVVDYVKNLLEKIQNNL